MARRQASSDARRRRVHSAYEATLRHNEAAFRCMEAFESALRRREAFESAFLRRNDNGAAEAPPVVVPEETHDGGEGRHDAP